MSHRLTVLALLTLAALLAAEAGAQAPAARDIMQKNRELHRAKDEEETLAVKIMDKRGGLKQRRLVRATLSAPDGTSKVLVRFVAPRDIANTGLLIWEGRDGQDDQWLYLPGTKKVKRIAASGKKNRFLGTDFAFEDLRPESIAAHRYENAGSEVLDGQDCWIIEAFPATEREAADSGYSKRRLWVRKDIVQIVKREFYDTKGRLEKVQTDRRLANVRSALWRADEIEMHDVQSDGRTVLTLEKRALDTGLKDSLFTETELAREGS